MNTDSDRNFVEHLTWDEVARRIERWRRGHSADRSRRQAARISSADEHRPHPGRMARGQARRTHRRPDLADGELRILSGVRRLCRQREPVRADLRNPDPGDRRRNHRLWLPRAVRARYRHQHAGAGRSCAGRQPRRAASQGSRRAALSPRRQRASPRKAMAATPTNWKPHACWRWRRIWSTWRARKPALP